jgi:hypothetical protein
MNAVIDATHTGARKVDLSKGKINTDVSAQWWKRPDDERFLDLPSLHEHVAGRRDRYTETTIGTELLKFAAHDFNDLTVGVDGQEVGFTNWSMNQICRQLGVPMPLLQRLPAKLAAINLQTLAMMDRSDSKFLIEASPTDGRAEMRAVTSPTYGRIFDADVVEQVIRVAANGPWKVPGTMRFGSGIYDPTVPVSKSTTTLFASDRDVFVFLCDDLNPIEVGKDRNGDPDLMFRGFMARNSETGAAKFQLDTMYLRAICENRILWGVEEHQTFSIVHRSGAPTRFAEQVMPALELYTSADPMKLVNGVREAKATVVAKDDDDQLKFLTDMGFSQAAAAGIVKSATTVEGRPPETVWDMAQGITSFAQTAPFGDARLEYEVKAGKLLDKVAG